MTATTSTVATRGPTAVASDGTDFLVVWQDMRNGNADIYGARVTADGKVLDPSGIAIATGTGSQVAPSIAFDGQGYLVVWGDDRNGTSDIYGARVKTTGAVVDPRGLPLATGDAQQRAPRIAFDGERHLVAYEQSSTKTGSDVYGMFVDLYGRPGTAFAIASAGGDQLHPALTFGVSGYLVTWEDHRGETGADTYARLVDLKGTVSSELLLSVATLNQTRPAVSYDGFNFLAAYGDELSDGTTDISGLRLSDSGKITESGLKIGHHAVTGSGPSIAFDGSRFLIAWGASPEAGYGVYGDFVKMSQ
jgi:hypothetical protein